MVEKFFVNIGEGFWNWVSGLGASDLWSDFWLVVLKMVGILLFILVNALWLVYMERKVSAYMQCRIGPNRVGPKGLLQTACDIGKLISKEFTWNRYTDKIVYMIAAILVFVPPFMIYAVLPFGDGMTAIPHMNIGLMYVIAISSLSTIILFAAGWSSNNKYSLVGGMRAVAQMVSYELPFLLCILGVVIITGTLDLNEIVTAQENVWFICVQPLAAIMFFVAALAETNRTPFCLVEGDSEIISGPYTEYSGMPFAMFFLTEYAGMMVMSSLFTVLFLGGWAPIWGLDFIPSWLWFFLKMYLMIFVFMWVRWTFPRVRVDHLMGFGWKILLPLSLANIFVTGLGVYIYRLIA